MHERPSTPPNVLQAKLQLKLYERLISPGGPTTYQVLAEDLGVVASTVHRQCTGDVPVQVRTVFALLARDSEGGQQMLDLFAEAAGIEWHSRDAADSSQAALVAAAARTIQTRSRSLGALGKALEDGRITADEVPDMLTALRRDEHEGKTLLSKLERLEAGPASGKVQSIAGAGA